MWKHWGAYWLVWSILNLSASHLSAAEPSLRILFLGDSLTEGYGIEKNQAYPALVQAELERQGYAKVQVINGGISGSTSASALGRLKWYLKVKPEILVLALGANDGLRGLEPENMQKNLGAVIVEAQKHSIQVVLAGMKMPPNYGDDYTRRFEQVFPDLAREYQVPLIPFLLEGVGGNPELNQSDGIHPTAAGHQQMAKVVIPHLLPLLAKQK